jgi:hypothetical protein
VKLLRREGGCIKTTSSGSTLFSLASPQIAALVEYLQLLFIVRQHDKAENEFAQTFKLPNPKTFDSLRLTFELLA